MPRRELGLYAEKCPERGRDLREEVIPRLAAWLGRAGMGGVGEELFGKLSVREGGGGTWGMLATGNFLVSFQKVKYGCQFQFQTTKRWKRLESSVSLIIFSVNFCCY